MGHWTLPSVNKKDPLNLSLFPLIQTILRIRQQSTEETLTGKGWYETQLGLVDIGEEGLGGAVPGHVTALTDIAGFTLNNTGDTTISQGILF